MRIPRLEIRRDANPMTGAVWVVDENNHCVANFRIKLPECHVLGATSETMDAGLNADFAREFITKLTNYWEPKPKEHTPCQQ